MLDIHFKNDVCARAFEGLYSYGAKYLQIAMVAHSLIIVPWFAIAIHNKNISDNMDKFAELSSAARIVSLINAKLPFL